MTAKTPTNLNRDGNGRGKKVVTRPVTKKRGARATAEVKAKDIAQARKGRSLTNTPVAEIEAATQPLVLTDKARAFVRYWAQGESITSASAKAGYGDGASYAYRIAHHPTVKALYAEEKRLYEEASQMTRKQVIDGLLEGIEMAKLLAEPASVISGWKTIGQMCGYFEPIKKKLEISVNGQVVMQKMEQMSDADLLKLLNQTAASEVLGLEDGADGEGA